MREEIRQLEGKHKGPSLIQRAKEAVKEAKSAVKEVMTEEVTQSEEASADEVIDELSVAQDTSSSGVKEGVHPEGSEGSDLRNNEEGNTYTQSDTRGAKPRKTAAKLLSIVSQNGSTSRVYLPIQEAAQMLGYDLRHVKSLRTKGVLKTSRKNSDLVSMASVKALISKRESGGKIQSDSESTETVMPTDTSVNDQSVKEASEGNTERVERSETTV